MVLLTSGASRRQSGGASERELCVWVLPVSPMGYQTTHYLRGLSSLSSFFVVMCSA
jgi:hypothetical protein